MKSKQLGFFLTRAVIRSVNYSVWRVMYEHVGNMKRGLRQLVNARPQACLTSRIVRASAAGHSMPLIKRVPAEITGQLRADPVGRSV